MTYQKLMTDFIRRYSNYILYAVAAWFIVTAMIAYVFIASFEDINMIMCFGYVKAKVRSCLFFLPDNWFSGVSVKAGAGHFRRLIAVWSSVFEEEGWKLYLCVFGTFITSFLICGAVAYMCFKKQIEKFKKNTSTTGLLMSSEQYREKYPEAFGDHLTFAGLTLAQQVFKTPFYVWGNDESINKVLEQFLESARDKKKKVVIFEGGNSLYKNLSTENDILLNPLEENGVSWDFFADMKHYDILIKELMKKISVREKRHEIEELIKYLTNLNINTKGFFQTLCFSSFDQIQSTLMAFTNIKDNKNSFIKIRNQIADDLYCFKTLLSKAKGMLLNEYYQSMPDKPILWISCSNNAHLKSIIPFVEKTIGPNISKITNEKNLIKLTANTIVINDSLDNLYYNSSKIMLPGSCDNKSLIASFGDTVTEYPSFIGIKYKRSFEKIIKGKDINIHSFFQYARTDDVLQC